jgi:predicted Zn-dependent protease
MDRRKFLTYMGCGCCSLILPSCGTTPITDRKQLKLIPEGKLNAQAAQIYEKIKEKEKLIKESKELSQIKNIGKKMQDSISEYFYQTNQNDPTTHFDWEYILIDNKKIKNAWCMPGGKIAVYTGMLDITKNTNGLAAVMGHEIAHAVAKHSVERASRGVLINIGTKIIDITSGGKLSQVNRTTGMDTVGMLSKIGLMNPFNRKQESEADYLGLIFSSLSGFDIRETVNVWERMQIANKGKLPPEFLSTHPSPLNRIKKINEWMNEIIIKYPPIT